MGLQKLILTKATVISAIVRLHKDANELLAGMSIKAFGNRYVSLKRKVIRVGSKCPQEQLSDSIVKK
jgi:hypothetical protein